jgi:hypothetical protein
MNNRKQRVALTASTAAVALAASAFMADAALAQSASDMPADTTYVYSPASTPGPLTRAQVREELANWRTAGILNPGGEIGDTEQVLAARQAYNELQFEVVTARWAQETQRMVKAREAEHAAQLARDEIEAVLAAGERERGAATATATGPDAGVSDVLR